MTAAIERVQGFGLRRRPSHYERFAGASHWLPLDAPDALSDRLIEFFKNPS